MRLSDISIRALKPPEKGQRTYLDDSIPGFGVRISQGGTRTFTLMYGAKRSLVTIGRYPIISLQEARGEAKRFLAERTLGKHRPKTITFEKAKAQFLAVCEQRNKPRTLYDYTRLLKRYGFGAEHLADISPHDINRMLERIKSPAERHHYFVVLRAFFNFAHQQHFLDHSPMERMEEPPKPKKRTRLLSDTELDTVFKTSLAGNDSFSRITALLALTGQRRGEVGGLQWAWINQTDRTISLPPGFHVGPGNGIAAAILSKIDCCALPSNGRRPRTAFVSMREPPAALRCSQLVKALRGRVQPTDAKRGRRPHARKLSERDYTATRVFR
jgi:integrase